MSRDIINSGIVNTVKLTRIFPKLKGVKYYKPIGLIGEFPD